MGNKKAEVNLAEALGGVEPGDLAAQLAEQARDLRKWERDRGLVKFMTGRARTLDELQEFLGGVSRQIVHLRIRELTSRGVRVWSPSPHRPTKYFIPEDGTPTPAGV